MKKISNYFTVIFLLVASSFAFNVSYGVDVPSIMIRTPLIEVIDFGGLYPKALHMQVLVQQDGTLQTRVFDRTDKPQLESIFKLSPAALGILKGKVAEVNKVVTLEKEPCASTEDECRPCMDAPTLEYRSYQNDGKFQVFKRIQNCLKYSDRSPAAHDLIELVDHLVNVSEQLKTIN